MCSKCKSQYGKGGWDKDKEGNDEFCRLVSTYFVFNIFMHYDNIFRWCSEGGQIYLCDFCPHAFCSKCLRWNLGRKYLKKVEDDEKWKCLICDASDLLEHRALYWAIYKYHKDKKPKVNASSSSPVKQNKSAPANNFNPPSAASKPKTLVNQAAKTNGHVKSQHPTNANKPLPSLKTIETVYKKLQENNFVTVSPVKKGSPQKQLNLHVKKESVEKPEEQKHFVDLLFKDADDCVQQMVYMIGEARKAWKLSGKKDKDIPVVSGKLRKALELTKQNIDEVDSKVRESCVQATGRDRVNGLSPQSRKAKQVNGSCGKKEADDEEGIHDVSIDELEIAANVKDEIYNTPTKKGKVQQESIKIPSEVAANKVATVKKDLDNDPNESRVGPVETNLHDPIDEIVEGEDSKENNGSSNQKDNLNSLEDSSEVEKSESHEPSQNDNEENVDTNDREINEDKGVKNVSENEVNNPNEDQTSESTNTVENGIAKDSEHRLAVEVQ